MEYQTVGGTKYFTEMKEKVATIHSIEVGPRIKVNRRGAKTFHAEMRCVSQKPREAKIRAKSRPLKDGALTLGSNDSDIIAQLVIHVLRPGTLKAPPKMIVEEEVFETQIREVQSRPPPPKSKPGRFTDFEEIMRRRKNQVDTMDNTGRLMRELSNQANNCFAPQKKSELWEMVRDCLKDKTYMLFQHRRIGSFGSIS